METKPSNCQHMKLQLLVDMQILQANKTANAFDDIGSTITRLVLLHDYDDGGRLTIAHVLTEKERINKIDRLE